MSQIPGTLTSTQLSGMPFNEYYNLKIKYINGIPNLSEFNKQDIMSMFTKFY